MPRSESRSAIVRATATEVVERSTITDGDLESAGEPLRTEADLLHLPAAGQRQEHDIGLLCHFIEGSCATRAGSIQRRKCGVAQVEGDDVAAVLLGDIAAHGSTHDPETHETDDGKLVVRHGGLRCQSIHMPPLISSDVPVIQLEAAEHRNSAACAMSSALP